MEQPSRSRASCSACGPTSGDLFQPGTGRRRVLSANDRRLRPLRPRSPRRSYSSPARAAGGALPPACSSVTGRTSPRRAPTGLIHGKSLVPLVVNLLELVRRSSIIEATAQPVRKAISFCVRKFELVPLRLHRGGPILLRSSHLLHYTGRFAPMPSPPRGNVVGRLACSAPLISARPVPASARMSRPVFPPAYRLVVAGWWQWQDLCHAGSRNSFQRGTAIGRPPGDNHHATRPHSFGISPCLARFEVSVATGEGHAALPGGLKPRTPAGPAEPAGDGVMHRHRRLRFQPAPVFSVPAARGD